MRRHTPLKPSRGTEIPAALRRAVRERDGGCVGRKLDWPGECVGAAEIDHVRASGGLGMKSPTVLGNLVLTCSLHHRMKTEYGRIFRPRLVEYLIASENAHEAHVDPCGPDCRAAVAR